MQRGGDVVNNNIEAESVVRQLEIQFGARSVRPQPAVSHDVPLAACRAQTRTDRAVAPGNVIEQQQDCLLRQVVQSGQGAP